MLPYSPSPSLSDLSANAILDHKFPFLRQPHCVQIIQLVEADAPPPPPRAPSDIDASSWASSSDYSSEYSESAASDDDDDEDEACSSYCSSDAEPEDLDAPSSEHSRFSAPESSDTYSLRIKRILAWRENFYSQAQSAISEPSSPSLKRKLELEDGDEDDNASHSSKRSRRSQTWSVDSGDSLMMEMPMDLSPRPSSSLCMHSCPACDAFFDTPQSLRQHGLDAQANEACCVAVQYAFE